MGHAIEIHFEREHRAARSAPASAPAQHAEDAAQTPRSGYGSVPGAEFPAFVYLSVLAAFGWIMLASWVAFARDTDAALALGIAVVLAIVFFALPLIIHRVAAAHSQDKQRMPHDFLSSPVETATGSLPGSSAWLQVLLIPLALALAATLIGATYLLVG